MSNEELADQIIELVQKHTLRVDRARWPEADLVEWLEQQRQDLKAKVVALLAPRVEQSPEERPDVQDDGLPEGFWTVVPATNGYEVVIFGDPVEGDDHNCDMMGCGQQHVVYRRYFTRKERLGIGPERGEKPEEEPTDGE